jgi:hypothetical protein
VPDAAAKPPPSLRPRTLAAADLDGPPLEVLKTDRRSRVWFVATSSGDRAVKRFEHSPMRQRAAVLLGVHPAQRELRGNRRLQQSGVPVVPIVDAGLEPAGAGCRAWIATPVAGRSLQRVLRDDADPARASRLLDRAAELAAALVAAGWWLKDYKPSNIIVDESGAMRLIDVGGTRRYGGPAHLDRMLAVMDRALARDGVGESPRRAFADRTRRSVGSGGAP